MSRVSASVVLYNTPEQQLLRLLDCIRKSSPPLALYLVDNSSPALDFPCLREPGITYVRSTSNRGYGAGHNLVLRELPADVEFHFVLNPDICFEPGELEKMLDYMRSEPAVGQLMPKVTYPDGSLQYLCKLVPSPADVFLRRFLPARFARLIRKRAHRYELRHSGYDQIMDVPFLSGCFMLFRMSALKQVGLFDERFFMYAEDIDITRRMHARFRTVYYPGATIVHDHARASYRSGRALRTHIVNMIRYFNKWGWIGDRERDQFNRETLIQIEQQARRS